MRRLLAFILSLLTLILPLISCGGGDLPLPTAEEVTAAAKELLLRSVAVNTVFLGDGIPATEEAFEGYLVCDEEYCQERGLTSVEALREAAAAVYTEEVTEILYRKALTTNDEVLADYRDRALGRGLVVLADREAWYRDTTHDYLTESLLVGEITRDTAKVTVRVRITPEGKPPQERTLTLPLVRTEEGWRCDKLTCISYDDDLNEQ